MINKLKETIILTASYYGKALSEPVLEMYVDDLSDLPIQDVIAAYRNYRRNSRNVHFPLPAQIRGLVAPEVDTDSASREIAARMCGAVPKFGWPNGDEAHAYIGEVGWRIIQSYGGWQYFCEQLGKTIDPTQFSAQARELAKVRLTHSPQAIEKAIGIGASISKPQLMSAAEIIAHLPIGKGPA